MIKTDCVKDEMYKIIGCKLSLPLSSNGDVYHDVQRLVHPTQPENHVFRYKIWLQTQWGLK